MARFGQLYLSGGTWNKNRILSEDWVRQSTTSQLSAEGLRETYGYHWWIINLPRHDNVFDLTDEKIVAAAAVGRGGQWVLIYPDLKLVAVFTGGNDNTLSNQAQDMLRRYVFPALLQ
jgi:CubicO group peptidase (beta-lactamase class C family)